VNAFEKYLKLLEPFEIITITKTEFIGSEEFSKGFFQTKNSKEPSELYGLQSRYNILLNNEIILLNAIDKKGIHFEVMFQNIMRLLMDNSSSEYLFTSEFFFSDLKGRAQDSIIMIFNQVFGPTISLIQVLLY
jgi:hypothetical protein